MRVDSPCFCFVTSSDVCVSRFDIGMCVLMLSDIRSPLLSGDADDDAETADIGVEEVGVAQRQLAAGVCCAIRNPCLSLWHLISILLGARAAAGRCVTVRGLRKEFETPDGIKRAVDGVDLTMYEGQIFCLLGHNGKPCCSLCG